MISSSRTESDVINWVFLFLTILLAGIHLYLGLAAPLVRDEHSVQFVVIALVLLVGPVVYFTPYWRPVLYLIGAGSPPIWVRSGCCAGWSTSPSAS
jgi:hypothetical protein